jgi:hypothetical protein
LNEIRFVENKLNTEREGGGGEPRAKRVGRRRGQKIGRRVVCKREREREKRRPMKTSSV